jgi:cell wall-associated NlpC family hydrolase
MWDPRGSRADLRSGAQGAPTGITGGGSLGIDSSDLQTLHTRLGTVITDVGKLDTAVQKLAKSLGAASGAWGGIGGGKGGIATAGGANLSTASFGTPITFGGAKATTPIMGAGGGAGGGLNTTAPVSAFGGNATRMIALGAMGEVGAQMAGGINSAMAANQAGGMPTDLIARQANNIWGGSGSGNTTTTVSTFTGLRNAGPNDLNTALGTIQNNSLVMSSLKAGSRNQKNMFSFLNAASSVGGMTASQSTQMVNSLTSGPLLQYLQTVTGGRGALINPKTLGVGGTNTVMKNIMAALDPGSGKMSGATLRTSFGGGNAQLTEQNWTKIQGNLAQRGVQLPTGMMQFLMQYASTGGNLPKASQAMSGTQWEKQLGVATAQTSNTEAQYQHTKGARSLIAHLDTWWADTKRDITQHLGPIPSIVAGGAAGLSRGLGAASHIAGGAVLLKGASTLFGAGAGGVSGAASTVMGGGRGGGGPMGGQVADGSQSSPFYIRGSNETGNTWPVSVQLDQISLTALGHLLGGGGTTSKKTTTTTTAKKKSSSGGLLGDLENGIKAVVSGAAIEKVLKYMSSHNPPGTGGGGEPEDIPMGDPSTGATTTKGMTPTLAGRMSAMMKANPAVQISSGHRTSQQQANLYALKGGQGVAAPGHSAHQAGKAADVGPPSQFKWIAANAQKFGLYTPAPKSEPWHLQAMGDPTTAGGASGATGSSVVSIASGQLGTPYVYGGETAGKAFDCSGLVQYVFAQVGISLPRTSQQQATVGKAVSGLSAAQPGDLILYNEPGEGPNSHVAIYIGGGKQIAAPHTGTVVQIQAVDTAHLSTIRRVVSGGAGQGVVQAAQASVGQPANDSHSGGGMNVGTGNSFLSMVSGLGGMEGAAAGGGVAGGSSSSGTASTSPSAGAGGSATGSSAILSSSGGSISTPTQFSQAVLAGLGIGDAVGAITDINAWQQHEGQWGASGAYNAKVMHDPLNTKLPEPGSSSLGGLTNSYPSWAEGVAATVSTIKQGNMAPILSALKSNASLSVFSKALESTGWAQSAYGGAAFASPSGQYAVGDPGTSFTPSGSGMGGSAAFSMSGGHTGGNIYVTMPIQMSGGTPGEASQFANMVIDAIERRTGMKVVQDS